MATPSVTANLTTISSCESTTGWSGPTLALDPDVKKEGSNSISAIVRNDGEQIYYAVTNQDYSGEHIRFWVSTAVYGAMKTKANGGLRFFLYDGTNTAYWNIAGIDTYAGGWLNIVVYSDSTPDSGTVDTSSIDRLGIEFGLTFSFKRVIDTWVDYLRYGDGLTITGGTSGDEINLSGVAAIDLTNGYGIVEQNAQTGVNAIYGKILIGNGATTTWFKEDGTVSIFADANVNSSLYGLRFQGTGCRGEIKGSTINAYNRKWFLDCDDADLVSMNIEGCTLVNINNSNFKSGQTINNNVFDNCGQIVPSTSTFNNNTISNYVGTSGAILYPTNDSNIESLTFINCDNGVEYDATSDSTLPAFNDFTFDDVSGNYDVNNTSGSAVSISKNNGSNPNSYNPGGSTVTFIGSSVTVGITVKDLSTNAVISNARVFLEVTSGVNFPYQASITITGTGTTATVTHTAHGLNTGDYVVIRGATPDVYNGQYSITVTGVNEYTYTTNQTIGSSPATGTITSTFLIISGLTDGSGYISNSRVYDVNQPFKGWIRKSTTSPYYRQGNLTDTVNSANGYNAVVLLSKDE